MKNLTIVICIFLSIIITSIPSGASVIIGLGDCRLLLNYITGSDVNFTAGFDVRGKQIKGADYNIESKVKLQDTMTFNIAPDIARKYNLSKINMTAQMTIVKVTIKNGRVFFNDHLIVKTDQTNLEARCRSVINTK